MRTQKRFTPSVLTRFLRDGRGTGTYADYIPWHRVSRADPSSHGRSHLLIWRDRQRELLSDGEWTGLNFAALLPNVLDLTEQFPLHREDASNELSRWDIRTDDKSYPGTMSIAQMQGIRHPRLKEFDTEEIWTCTTDLLLVLGTNAGQKELLAVSIKQEPIKALSERAKQLLLLEKTYWQLRDVTWLLITPEEYQKSVGLTLRRTAPWGLADPVDKKSIAIAQQVARARPFHPYSDLMADLSDCFGGSSFQPHAQQAFWQAVWQGLIPIDLRRGWRPHLPLQFISSSAFLAQNPIAARRSACL
ncbi:TnsA endonuclease N-terminal domain-containing protein [Pantoea sp. 18069]|uniref:TnsA endonuclease N-terminal domain-containing protein n=1 Tax=Pantoea sp. 18069 TaxID=2681415 RepID=UPI00135815FE|nr:TnsA endonuclease N-terminal domain-containing protein [Pantoea sp. 18069]